MAFRAARPGSWRSFSNDLDASKNRVYAFEDGVAPPMQQRAFDNVIDLLIRTAPRPILSLASVASEDEKHRFKVRQVQVINDSLDDDECVAWYQRALELTF